MLGIENWVNYRTKKQRKEDAQKYNALIFPFGMEQRDKVFSMLRKMIEYNDEEIMLYNYLIIKQKLMEFKGEISEETIASIRKSVKNTLKKKEDDFRLYLAMADADLKIDERLEYPSEEEIKESAKQISLP